MQDTGQKKPRRTVKRTVCITREDDAVVRRYVRWARRQGTPATRSGALYPWIAQAVAQMRAAME